VNVGDADSAVIAFFERRKKNSTYSGEGWTFSGELAQISLKVFCSLYGCKM
jgi:hypothetical protein